MIRTMLRGVGLVVIAIASIAHAQLGRSNMTENGVMLLGSPRVRKEIGLKGKAEKDVAAAFQTYADRASGLLDTYVKDRARINELNAKLKEAMNAYVKKALGIMSTANEARLRQLAIQSFGTFSISVPDVQKELKLTPTQISKVNAAYNEFDQFMKAVDKRRKAYVDSVRATRPANTSDREAMLAWQKRVQQAAGKDQEKDLAAIRDSSLRAERTILASITAQQHKQFESMKGKRYDFTKG